MTFGGQIVYLKQINNMHDKSHVIIIIITILNKKLEMSKIAVKKSDRICSGPKRYHYRPAARAFSRGQFVHLALYSDDNHHHHHNHNHHYHQHHKYFTSIFIMIAHPLYP